MKTPLLLIVFATFFLFHPSGLKSNSINLGHTDKGVTNNLPATKSVNDTIVRIVIPNEDCTFADHAEYGIYIPASSDSLQGALVLQHGCGMEQYGITRPYDIQYQAFARKWNLAIVETALYGDCGVWSKPASGSAKSLFNILKRVGKQINHPELASVPMFLWGHSGGGFWTLAMLHEYPEKILGAVCYSAAWDPKWEYSETAAKVPLILRHAGVVDNANLCWNTATNTFNRLRKMDAPVILVHNKGQGHNFSYIRYMAIPFYETVLKQRLPEKGCTKIRDINRNYTWLGDTVSLQIYKESDYPGNKSSMCLFPDEVTARNWREFVQTGTVTDKTPPPMPYNLELKRENGNLKVRWNADADIESGILKFNIYKNDVLIGRLPEKGAYQTFNTNGDNSEPADLPVMEYIIPVKDNDKAKIGIETVNHFDLVSKRTEIITK